MPVGLGAQRDLDVCVDPGRATDAEDVAKLVAGLRISPRDAVVSNGICRIRYVASASQSRGRVLLLVILNNWSTDPCISLSLSGSNVQTAFQIDAFTRFGTRLL